MVRAAHVLRVRDGLKMIGANAILHPAKMIDLEVRRDRAERLLPHCSVSKSLATTDADATVSSPYSGCEGQDPARGNVSTVLNRVITGRDGLSLRGAWMRVESSGMTLSSESQMLTFPPSFRAVSTVGHAGSRSASTLTQSSHRSKHMGTVG